MTTDFSSCLTNADLKLLLSSRGLSTVGTKEELIQRLRRDAESREREVWTWTQLPSLPSPRIDCRIVQHLQSVYVLGGHDVDGKAVEDILQWTPGQSSFLPLDIRLPESSCQDKSWMAVVRGNALWLVRRRNSWPSYTFPSASALDLSNRSWQSVDNRGHVFNLLSNSGHPLCWCVDGDRLLALTSKCLRISNFESGHWSTIPMKEDMDVYHMTVFASQTWIMGWSRGLQLHIPRKTSIVGILDENGTITPVQVSGQLPSYRDRCRAVTLGHRCILHGGSPLGTGPSLSDTYVFDLIKRHWTKLNEDGIAHPRAFYGATAYGDDAIVVCGGRRSWLSHEGGVTEPCLDVSVLTLREMERTAHPDDVMMLFRSDAHIQWLRPFRRALFDSPRMSDVTIMMRNCSFHGHRLFLAEASPVFESMLTADCIENKTGAIEIADAEEEDVRTMLRYIYGCPLEIPQEKLLDILQLADMYEIYGLHRYCMERLIDGMKMETMLECWNWAEFHNSEELMRACVDRAIEETEALQKSTAFSSFAAEQPDSCSRLLEKVKERISGRASDARTKREKELLIGDLKISSGRDEHKG